MKVAEPSMIGQHLVIEPPPYEQLATNFDWAIAERELGYRPGDVINIGWMCSDRLCGLGLA
jgi:hypothetical protein